MRSLGVFLVSSSACLASSCTSTEVVSAYAGAVDRTPVIVELFSSEGCSSCPSADAVLHDLATKQPVDGASVIALELHVDYWNDLGWADPFSSAEFSARQRRYSAKSGRSGVYTPQMVVDGDREFLGSQEATAKTAIAAAAKSAHAKVELTRQGDAVHVKASGIDNGGEGVEVFVAIVEDGLSTAVPRGENAGTTLKHGPVVRRLVKVADATGTRWEGDAAAAPGAGVRREDARAVVFFQRKASLRILGAGAISLK